MYTKNTGEERFMNIPRGTRTTNDTKHVDISPSFGSTSAPRSKRLEWATEENDYYTKGGLYVNASKVIKREAVVDGKTTKFSLIATQCPNKETLNAFWDLVCSSANVDGVIALGTGLTDYWSKKAVNGDLYQGINFAVDIQSKSKVYSANKRILNVCDMDTGETKQIEHYHFKNWPDGKVPNNLDDFENFVKHFVKKRKLVVHCLAGVGRTGTFAACLDAFKHGITKPLEMIEEMRKYRTWMVQSPMQFDVVCKFIARNCLDLKKLGLPKPQWDDEFDYDKYFNPKESPKSKLNNSSKSISPYVSSLTVLITRLNNKLKPLSGDISSYISDNEKKFKEKFKNSLLFNTKLRVKENNLKKCKKIKEIESFLNAMIE